MAPWKDASWLGDRRGTQSRDLTQMFGQMVALERAALDGEGVQRGGGRHRASERRPDARVHATREADPRIAAEHAHIAIRREPGPAAQLRTPPLCRLCAHLRGER